jgi:hypothetical protein
MAEVAFQHVGKVYPEGTRAVDDLSLEIDDGEFVIVAGASSRQPSCSSSATFSTTSRAPFPVGSASESRWDGRSCESHRSS